MFQMENLEKKIEQHEEKYMAKYPLLFLVNNRDEIKEISENAIKYASKLATDSELRIPIWEIMPRVAVEVVRATVDYIAERKRTDIAEQYFDLGNTIRVAIEYAETEDADKIGTFNPKISVLDDMKYGVPYDDTTMTCNEIFDTLFKDCSREIIVKISERASSEIQKSSGARIANTQLIMLLFTAFMRKTKDFLIEHKDDNDWGFELDIAGVYFIGISKFDDETSETGADYTIYITPAKELKQRSKDDNTTEVM